MASDRLVVFEGQNVYRIGWYLVEEQDMGATLGEASLAEIDSDIDEDYRAALKAIEELPDVEKDKYGYYWDSKTKANQALKIAKIAIKNCSVELPDWAKQALAAGWKPPKGWKP